MIRQSFAFVWCVNKPTQEREMNQNEKEAMYVGKFTFLYNSITPEGGVKPCNACMHVLVEESKFIKEKPFAG